MRLLLLCSCLLSLCLPVYCQKAPLQSDLLSPSRASGDQVAAHIMLLSEETHEPRRVAVELFARDLIASLSAARPESAGVPAAQADALTAEIDRVLKSAGTSTVAFYDHVRQFERVLLMAGTTRPAARRLATELETIGRQVRGPEDFPVR